MRNFPFPIRNAATVRLFHTRFVVVFFLFYCILPTTINMHWMTITENGGRNLHNSRRTQIAHKLYAVHKLSEMENTKMIKLTFSLSPRSPFTGSITPQMAVRKSVAAHFDRFRLAAHLSFGENKKQCLLFVLSARPTHKPFEMLSHLEGSAHHSTKHDAKWLWQAGNCNWR